MKNKPTRDYEAKIRETLRKYKKEVAEQTKKKVDSLGKVNLDQKTKQDWPLERLKFNPKQKKILIVGIVIVLLIGVVPPWKHTFKSSSTYSEVPAGYSFITSPPPRRSKSFSHGIKIDISRLVIQWIVTIAATTAGVMLTAKKD
jgi:hypothetical protein